MFTDGVVLGKKSVLNDLTAFSPGYGKVYNFNTKIVLSTMHQLVSVTQVSQ